LDLFDYPYSSTFFFYFVLTLLLLLLFVPSPRWPMSKRFLFVFFFASSQNESRLMSELPNFIIGVEIVGSTNVEV
jgi:hypothetical protein